jgi:hypothetical protein
MSAAQPILTPSCDVAPTAGTLRAQRLTSVLRRRAREIPPAPRGQASRIYYGVPIPGRLSDSRFCSRFAPAGWCYKK